MPTDAQRFGRDIYLPDAPGDTLGVTATGDLLLVDGRANARAALRRRLVVSPGTLIHQPDYGVGLLDALELPNTSALRTQLSTGARRNLLADDRVAEATVGVSLGAPDGTQSASAMTVQLRVTWKADQRQAETLTLELHG